MIQTQLIKIGLSLLLSGFVGYEREHNDKPAGLRTIMSICLGATIAVLFNQTLAGGNFDYIRLPAYYLAAIGFVGGGIIQKTSKNKIEGITTASILLPIAIVGLFCGIGEYLLAGASTLSIYIILKLKYVEVKIIDRKLKRKKKK